MNEPTKRIAVVGAGVGGLTASIRLAQLGYRVTVFEARAGAGGLASSFDLAGLRFDFGPYILLDRPGLEWVFREVGLELSDEVTLLPIDPVYEVCFASGRALRVYRDRERSAEEMNRQWPESGRRYLELVASLERVYARTRALQFTAQPGLRKLFELGAWRDTFFLLRGLESVLGRWHLPREIADAVTIWTHVAGQPTREAPSPLALVAPIIHTVGAYYPKGGMGVIPECLARRASELGVSFHYNTKVKRLRFGERLPRVELEGDALEFDAVVSNASGIGTYLQLADGVPRNVSRELERLPLQTPGTCAYLRVKGDTPSTYLRFHIDSERRCRLLAEPRVLDAGIEHDGWYPARLIAPEEVDLLSEDWWQAGLTQYECLETRTPAEWGRDFHLYRNSMNPVMTSRLMRRGRLAHRSPCLKGLYLAGSATHPGQWVSFCAVSGILAAGRVHEDHGQRA